MLTAEPHGWRAIFGSYTPTLRPPDMIARQVQCLRSLLGQRTRPIDRRPSISRHSTIAAALFRRVTTPRTSPSTRAVRLGQNVEVEREAILVALDVGTSKVVALIGEVARDGSVTVIGKGAQASSGLKKGVVINIDQTVNTISAAREAAERLSGYRIESAIVAVGGNHRREPELARRGRRQRRPARGNARGHRARDRGRPRGQHPLQPRGAARPAARLHRRRPGGRQGSAWA